MTLFIVALVVAVAAAVALAVVGQRRARAHDELLEAERAERKAAEALAAEASAERERENERVRQELAEARAARERAEQARKVEHEWARKLRERVVELHHHEGVLGAGGGLRELVLRLALELTEAKKGLLLERPLESEDTDADHMKLICSLGFENDPAESQLAKRLAQQVLSRDETLREDDLSHETESAADQEVECLVAIPVYIADQFSGVVVCANRDGGFADLDHEVLISLGDHAGALLHNGRLQGELHGAYLATVGVLADAIAVKDPFLRGHSDDVAALVVAVAARVGVPAAEREQLLFGSLLHDVGKLGISERILLKPSGLTPAEYAAIQQHPRIGYRLVEQVPALRSIAPAVLYHHERFDGGGYPSGLAGEQIPLTARIIAVADSYSAMTQARPYREPMSSEEACEELVRGAGTQYDPAVAEAFVEEVRRRGPLTPSSPAPAADPEVAALRAEGEPLLGAVAAALTDSVTLLYSHRHLQETAAAEAKRSELQGDTFTVVVGEVAELDEINRAKGFAAGDRSLREVALTFDRLALTRPGAVAGRLSGKRLAIVACGEDLTLASELSATLDGHGVRLGTAVWSAGEDGEAVFARAAAAAAAV